MPTPEIRQQVQHRLDELHQRHLAVAEGSVASVYTSGRGYLPPDHDDAEPDRFAIAVATADGYLQSVGDDQHPFTLQSLSKVVAYGLALQTHGRERVLEHVGVEPSGDAFNSISFEARQKRPYNPMVNAGAIVTSDLAPGRTVRRSSSSCSAPCVATPATTPSRSTRTPCTTSWASPTATAPSPT